MSIALYMDVHVPFAITRGLRARGVDVLTAQDDGTTRLPDDELLDRATALQRTLFSQDTDLLVIASQRQQAGTAFSGVVYVAQLAMTIGQCVEELTLLAEASDAEDVADRVIYLPL